MRRILGRRRPCCHVFDPRGFFVEQGGDRAVECDHRGGGSIASGRRALCETMLCHDRTLRTVDKYCGHFDSDAALACASIMVELFEPSVENEVAFGASGCRRHRTETTARIETMDQELGEPAARSFGPGRELIVGALARRTAEHKALTVVERAYRCLTDKQCTIVLGPAH